MIGSRCLDCHIYVPEKCLCLQSLQFQIINRYIPCRYNLSLWYRNESPLCSLCADNEIDTIEHYFVTCKTLGIFGGDFRRWWVNTTAILIRLTTLDILFGIPNENDNYCIATLNYCILYAKQHIHLNKKENKDIKFQDYKQNFKNRLVCEKYIMEYTGKHALFVQKWQNILESLNWLQKITTCILEQNLCQCIY